MKLERTKNAANNFLFGTVLKIYQIIVPFLMRTAMIYFMGVQYLGLDSLFKSILQVLNLAELGVGVAMVFSMYKPIAEDDEERICALMNLYKLYYRIIGLVIAGLGFALLPFLPKLIHSDLPSNINLTVLYLLHLSATVFTYWLFAYKNALFQAHQRNDVISKISIALDTVKYIMQLLVLIFLKNYYIYIIIVLLTQILTNIVTAIAADRMYPNYKAAGELPKEERKQISQRIRDIFTARFGTVLGTSVDDIVISAFIGLSMVAVYQNYHYIMTAVINIFLVFFASCTAGVGNSLVTESPEKNYYDFRRLAFLTIWGCIICISCFACMYQPFMIFWVGKDLLLPDLMVLLMCIYFYLYVMQRLSCVYKDAAGIWHEDRFRPLIAGVVNIILNISLVRIWGVYAIVFSTIISYVLIAMPWIIYNLFSLVFKKSPKEYILEILRGALMAAVSGSLCYFLGNIIPVNGLAGIILRLFLAVVTSNAIVFMTMRKNSLFNPTIDLVNRLTKSKFKKFLTRLKTGENI